MSAGDFGGFAWGESLPVLETARVRLRGMTGADVDDVFAVFSDGDAMRYWSSPPQRERREADELVRDIEECFRERSLFQWGVTLREGAEGLGGGGGRVIGTCTLCRVEHGRGEIGFALARAAWGRGLMTEALGALIAFSFERLGLRRLEADVDPRNAPSLRLLERLGFEREGYLRERYCVGGEVQDSVMLGLLKRKWREER